MTAWKKDGVLQSAGSRIEFSSRPGGSINGGRGRGYPDRPGSFGFPSDDKTHLFGSTIDEITIEFEPNFDGDPVKTVTLQGSYFGECLPTGQQPTVYFDGCLQR